MTSKLLILVHEQDHFQKSTYLANEMVRFWEDQGVEVVVQKGTLFQTTADVAFLHVDQTIVPEQYLALLDRYPRVINGRVRDISKRKISQHRVHRGDNYLGPVIVKTNLNCGGNQEVRAIRKSGGIPKLLFSLRRKMPWSWRVSFFDYRIFSSWREVPRAAWFNRSLFVERFQPERSGDLYCLRTWTFFGDRETNSISYATAPIVKADRVVRRESLPEVPEELRRMRERLGFDFGKFDYGMVDGKVILYDANRTPNIGQVSEDFRLRLHDLSEGIRCFL